MSVEEVIKLLSAFGIGTIVSAIFVFIQSSKRNQLDYITKERSEWRKNIKCAIEDLYLEESKERLKAITRIKNNINPYGKDISPKEKLKNNYILKDGHIWNLLNDFSFSDYEIENLVAYLQLLLKFDWERSKREVTFAWTYSSITRYFLIVICSAMTYYAIIGGVNRNPILFLGFIISVLMLLFRKEIINLIIKFTTQDLIIKLSPYVYHIIYLLPYFLSLVALYGILASYIPDKEAEFSQALPYFLILMIPLSIYDLSTAILNNVEFRYIRNVSKKLKS